VTIDIHITITHVYEILSSIFAMKYGLRCPNTIGFDKFYENRIMYILSYSKYLKLYFGRIKSNGNIVTFGRFITRNEKFVMSCTSQS
jgi:hypothetical protein